MAISFDPEVYEFPPNEEKVYQKEQEEKLTKALLAEHDINFAAKSKQISEIFAVELAEA